MKEKLTQKNVIEKWASKFTEITRWLTKLQKKEASALNFYRFCEWAHKTPTELLALRERDASANTVEKLLDDFTGENTAGFTNAQKYNISIACKSFFKHNYRDLAKASGVVSLEKVRPYNKLSKEGLRKIYNRSLNPRDRALIPFVTCTGIAKETLTNLLWGHLEENWESKDLPCLNIGPELLKGHGRGKFKDVRQTTFLTPEAKQELLNYKGWVEDKLGRKVTPEDHIWLTTIRPYEPLSYAMLGNVADRLSNVAKVAFSLHDGRRWINTALEQIGISSNWARKIRGRKVRGEESPYSQPAIDQLRAKFREAVPLLEFTREDSGLEQRVQRQEAITQIQGKLVSGEPLTDDDRGKIKKFGIQLGSRATKRPHQDDCTDGENCQKMVCEEELQTYLSKGWRVVSALPSGQIVIEN